MQILLRAVGMQRVGRHLHSFQPSALLREACRIEGRFETGGVRVADADGGIDGHAERVDEPLRKKKAECARASLDEQPFEAPLFQFGNDPRRRKVGDTDDFGRCFERRCGSVVGEDDPCARACGEEVRRGGESQRTAQRDLRGVGRPVCRKALPAERFVAHGERRVVAAHGLRPHEDRVGPRPQAHHLAPVGGRRENQSPGRPIVHIAVARQGDRSVHVHRRNSNRVISGFAPIRMGNPTYPMPSLT